MKISVSFVLFAMCARVQSYQVNSNGQASTQKTALESSRVAEPSTLSLWRESIMPSNPPNYWFNSRIHTFGNTGVLGAVHAALAPFATMLIDTAAYDGKNIRETISEDLRDYVGKPNARIVDLCSGVGISTRALGGAFQDAASISGVDTSPEMIAMAQFLSSNTWPSRVMNMLQRGPGGSTCSAEFLVGNAERTVLPAASYDLVTIMYAFHEAPIYGRERMLQEAWRLLENGATLAVVDISPNYRPSSAMLAGEPYVLEYQANIDRQLRQKGGFEHCQYHEVVPGHVAVWVMNKKGPEVSKPAFVPRSQNQP